MSCQHDLIELSRHLKQERLFISDERNSLVTLNEEVQRTAEELTHIAWVARQQKYLLEQLILGNREATPQECYRQTNALETTCFVDGYKMLSHHEAKFGEFLKLLRESPKLVAQCLITGESVQQEMMGRMGRLLMSSVYGNMVMAEDEGYVLQVLRTLVEIQVANHAEPRRLLHKASCAFSIIFNTYTECLHSAKLFLTAALHQPVMQLLMEDEWFYDIDPNRALSRFPPEERLRRFGQPGTESYKEKTRIYRELIVNKLVMLTERFITSIRNNMHSFPHSLSCIISQLYHSVTKAGKVESRIVRSMCADLMFAFFICPAICDPEPYGITSDAPISYIANNNLMQVAQILQVLALPDLDGVDAKTRDLYEKFPKETVSVLIDDLLESNISDTALTPSSNAAISGYARAGVLISHGELTDLLNFFQILLVTWDSDSDDKKLLETMMNSLPAVPNIQPTSNASITATVHSNNASPTHTSASPSTPSQASRAKVRELRRLLTPDRLNTDENDSSQKHQQVALTVDDVLVISLGVNNECPGMVPEQKVLEQDTRKSKHKSSGSFMPGVDDIVLGTEVPLQEKRTRFSLSHDQDSIATSDNLEAISEAASSHSVGSDLENENDNLSDMVSANVSGRGTPNISGRDTPTSQAGSQSEVIGQEDREMRQEVPNLPVMVKKENRVDVTDRFGKFDIKSEIERFDTKSNVSDTWSTDVLASDSEPPEQNQLERLEEVAEEMIRQQNMLGVQEILEVSETNSDAWSTDVLASDTSEWQAERLLELDQDEVSSVHSRGTCADDPEVVYMPLAGGATRGSAGATGDHTPQASGGESPDFQYESNALNSNVNFCPIVQNSPTKGSGGAAVNLALLQGTTQHSAVPDFKTHPRSNQAMEPIGGQFKRNNSSNESSNSSSKQDSIAGVVGAMEALSVITDHSDMLSLDPGVASTESTHSVSSIVEKSTAKSTENNDGKLDQKEGHGGAKRKTSAQKAKTAKMLNFDTPPKSLLRNSATASTNSNSPIVSENDIQLFERQNVKLDAHRLSQTVQLFDPLMQDSSSTDPSTEEIAAARRLSDPKGSDNVFNEPQQVYTTPRISVQSSSVDGGAVRVLSGSPNTEHRSAFSSKNIPSQFPPPTVMETSQEGEDSRCSTGSSNDSQKSESLPTDSSGVKGRHSTGMVAETSAGGYVAAGHGESPYNSECSEDEYKKKPGFFKSFKERISKGGKRKTVNGDISLVNGNSEVKSEARSKADGAGTPSTQTESSDDILAKYRRHAPSTLVTTPQKASDVTDKAQCEDEPSTPAYDVTNLEQCKAFLDAKRKLRLVLSTADFQLLPSMLAYHRSLGFDHRGRVNNRDNELVMMLMIQLAEAINLQDRDLIARLHETIRCLKQFDNDGVKKLLKSLREDYRGRSSYIAYLVRCRQGLLSTHAHLARLLKRVERDKLVCNRHFVSVSVRMFLQKKEKAMHKFISDFQKLTLADEKTDLVEALLKHLTSRLEGDAVWQAATCSQISDAHIFIERYVMSHVYTHAMYPNGDGDLHRDQILSDHISKLSSLITVSHKDLRIPPIYHYECPWPAAQADIFTISAYKTPRDKVACVSRCSTTIMNLLSLAIDKSVPGADDFMPVLIYVIIKANPPNLLSTVQYVSSFYENRFVGEEQYWWMQFVSAIEFIKTMDYPDT